jgi:hypothetical protein
MPALTATDVPALPSITNVTVPAADSGASVAVNVTLSSAVAGFRLDVTVVVVFALSIVKFFESLLPV